VNERSRRAPARYAGKKRQREKQVQRQRFATTTAA
jgi:hypothetical protein